MIMEAELNDFTADLEELVTCGICNNITNTPKTLKCCHTFCLRCLEGWYQQCQTIEKEFHCPTCRTPVQEDDVNHIPTSFEHYTLIELYNTIKAGDQQHLPCFECSSRRQMVGFCFHCGGMLCNVCYSMHNLTQGHQAKMWNSFTKENIISYIECKSLCQEKYHEKCRLEYFCQTCKKSICQKCAMTAHSIHGKVSLEEACEEVQNALGQEKHRLSEVVEIYENEQKLYQKNRERIKNQVQEVEDDVVNDNKIKVNILQNKVHVDLALLKEHLHKRENEMKKKTIDEKLEQARSLRDQCKKMESLTLKQFILERHRDLKELCQTVKGTPILPTRSIERYSSVRYVPNPEALRILQDLELGKIEVSVTDPSRCTIESVGNTRHGFMNQFNIITRDMNGNECYTDESLIDVQIQDNEGNHVNKEITQSQPGTFIVKNKASKLSSYKLEVSIGGTPVSNSPQVAETVYDKAELKPVTAFNIPDVESAVALAVSESGLIAVVDSQIVATSPSRIMIYNSDGEFLREFGGEGTAGEAQLHEAKGVAFIRDSQILVSDNHDEHGLIKLYDHNGNYNRLIFEQKKMTFSRMCIANQNIACLAYERDSRETLIVLLSTISCAHLQNIRMGFRFDMPRYVTYHDDKYLISGNNGLFVFDANGALIPNYFRKGDYTDPNKGQLNFPRGLGVFGTDMFLVCDLLKHRVQLLDQEGGLINSFGSYAIEDNIRQMDGPIDVAVTSYGQVLVLDRGGHLVHIFR